MRHSSTTGFIWRKSSTLFLAILLAAACLPLHAQTGGDEAEAENPPASQSIWQRFHETVFPSNPPDGENNPRRWRRPTVVDWRSRQRSEPAPIRMVPQAAQGGVQTLPPPASASRTGNAALYRPAGPTATYIQPRPAEGTIGGPVIVGPAARPATPPDNSGSLDAIELPSRVGGVRQSQVTVGDESRADRPSETSFSSGQVQRADRRAERTKRVGPAELIDAAEVVAPADIVKPEDLGAGTYLKQDGFVSNASPARTIKALPSEDSGVDGLPVARYSGRRLLLSSGSPSIGVTMQGPGEVTVGKPATYVFEVKNKGDTLARGLFIRVAIPHSLQLEDAAATIGDTRHDSGLDAGDQLIWNIDELAARSEHRMEIVVTPTGSQEQELEIAVDWTLLPVRTSSIVMVRQPRLEIKLDGPSEVGYGDRIRYMIRLANPGTGDAENVTLRIDVDDEQRQLREFGRLQAGKERIVTVEFLAGNAGSVWLRAIASGADGLQQVEEHQIDIRRAQLSMSARGPSLRYAGSPAAFEIRVRNTGDAVAPGVSTFVSLPDGSKYLGGIQDANRVADGLQWDTGDLAPETEQAYRLEVQLIQPGQNTLQIVTRDDRGNRVAREITTVVEASADLKLSIDPSHGPLPVGDEVSYDIYLANCGIVAAQGVQIIARTSDGLRPLTVEGANAELLGQQVVFEKLEQVDAGRSVRVRLRARGETAGNHLIRVEVVATGPDTRLAVEETTRFFHAGTAESMRSTGQTINR